MMDCSDFYEKLSEYIDGELTKAEEAEMKSHMGNCVKCRGAYDAFTAVSGAVKNSAYSFTSPDFAAETVKKAAKTDIPYLWQKYNKAVAVLVAALAVVIFAHSARENSSFLNDNAVVDEKPEIYSEFALPADGEKEQETVEEAPTPQASENTPAHETKPPAVSQTQTAAGSAESVPANGTAAQNETDIQVFDEAEDTTQTPQPQDGAVSGGAANDAAVMREETAGNSSPEPHSIEADFKQADEAADNTVTDTASASAMRGGSSKSGGSASYAAKKSVQTSIALSYALPPSDSFVSEEAYNELAEELNSLKAREQNGENIDAEFSAFLERVQANLK